MFLNEELIRSPLLIVLADRVITQKKDIYVKRNNRGESLSRLQESARTIG